LFETTRRVERINDCAKQVDVIMITQQSPIDWKNFKLATVSNAFFETFFDLLAYVWSDMLIVIGRLTRKREKAQLVFWLLSEVAWLAGNRKRSRWSPYLVPRQNMWPF
jgi:hypothetical protein